MSDLLRTLRLEVGELVARHERGHADFTRYENDPAGFFREVLHCSMWSRQVEMAEAVRDYPRVVVVSCQSAGKDYLAARLALWWTYANRGLCILTGPSDRQVSEILMREVRRAFSRCPELPGELYSRELRLDGSDAGILAFTSNQSDRLTGFHHPRLLVCITEGQGVEDEAYEAALACATGPENRLLVYGNPLRRTGSFYRVAHASNWHRLTITASEHPNVTSGREEIPGAISAEWISALAEEYGVASSIYRSRVEAEFPSDAVEGLLQRAWLDAAVARWQKEMYQEPGARNEANLVQPAVLGIDVARFGADKSAIAYARGGIVRELATWGGAALTTSADRVIDYTRQVQARDVWGRRPSLWVDEPGLGGGLIDTLRERGWEVESFNGSAKPRDSRRFLNKRAESFWHLRRVLEAGKVALPPDDRLFEEMLASEWTISGGGQIQIAGKDLMRKELGRSPDRLDAVVIALAASMGAYSPPMIRFEHVRI